MTPEGKVRTYLKKRCKELGLEHRKLGWIGRRNAPDEFVFRPLYESVIRNGKAVEAPRAAFIECKAFGEVPNGGQVREIKRLSDAGFVVFVVDSEASVDEALRQLIG